MRGKWMRSAWVLTLAAGLGLAGCSEPPPPPEPPLEVDTDELGDRVDSGRFASCRYVEGTAPCGALESFDLTGCNLASLAEVDRNGFYTQQTRRDTEPPFFSYASFRLSADGTQDLFRGSRPTVKQVTADSFYLSLTTTTPQRTTLNSQVGCRVEQGRLYGCFASCRDGRLVSSGTFQAWRLGWRPGEAEASGLRLAAEARVQQGVPVDVYVTQGHAYVVSLPDQGMRGALSVFDVSDKSNPVLRRTLTLQTDGSSSSWNGVWAKGNALYVASAALGVIVFDITDPANPQFVLSAPQEQINVHTVFVDGDRLYAMSPSPTPATLIFDITNPLAPVLLSRYVIPGYSPQDPLAGYPHDAFAFEGRLYINHLSKGYIITDPSDPANVRKLGEYTYLDASSHANAVGRFGDRVIAFEGGENWGAHLRVLDVTDPARPRFLARYRMTPNVSIHNMILKGERLYVAWYQYGVRVLDVSRPEQPRELAYYNTFRETDPGRGRTFFDGAIGIRVPGDGYVYAVDMLRGLMIFPEP